MRIPAFSTDGEKARGVTAEEQKSHLLHHRLIQGPTETSSSRRLLWSRAMQQIPAELCGDRAAICRREREREGGCGGTIDGVSRDAFELESPMFPRFASPQNTLVANYLRPPPPPPLPPRHLPLSMWHSSKALPLVPPVLLWTSQKRSAEWLSGATHRAF